MTTDDFAVIARDRLAQHRDNLRHWEEPDGLLARTEPDPKERERRRAWLRAAIAELEYLLGRRGV
jgi:hypothetical protein